MGMLHLRDCRRVAVVFKGEFKQVAKAIYDTISHDYPHIDLFFLHKTPVLCPLKISEAFDGYVLVGLMCPLHTFPDNTFVKSVCNSTWLTENTHYVDYSLSSSSIYSQDNTIKEILDYIFDRTPLPPRYNEETSPAIMNLLQNYLIRTTDPGMLEVHHPQLAKQQMALIMKENINGKYIRDRHVFAIVFTSKYYELRAEECYRLLKKHKSNVFKLFLKDVSYERLISIDSVDCIILIDCPMFERSFNIHIPIISVFSLCRGIDEKWVGDKYSQNDIHLVTDNISDDTPQMETLPLPKGNEITKIFIDRTFHGVEYDNTTDDDEIRIGRAGLPSNYDGEGTP